ncbi:MAG: ABC transporter ATP-binding protein [Chloroflexi bacterium]|nr:ABC transporter ATP-binding protein [Chloroflexota bacterium]
MIDDAHVTSAHATTALRAQNLSKRYRRGRPPALDRIDLDITTGGITALVGPNGAGKSTLIRCFLGFERPTAGFVTVDGIDPARDRAKALSRIGYVGQDAGLYRQLTADEHLDLAAALRPRFDRVAAAERLEVQGISRSVPTTELSGGQQAQVALSLALGTRAPVLMLDEPVARLDPLARLAFLTTLRDAVRTDLTTVLLASHIIGDLVAVSDSLIVLAPGAVMFHGTIEAATTGHAVVAASEEIPPDDLVATYTGLTGKRMSLVRRPGTGDATLDDVVLGYLAAANAERTAA